MDIRVPIEDTNVSITRDLKKCISCGTCKSVCKYQACVYDHYEYVDEHLCINCGQCTLVCPTDSLHEVYEYNLVKQHIKNGKVVIFQTAPAVRVSLGEAFDMEKGTFVEGKLVSSLRRLGASYVFDTTFGADLTIMEEANELVNRINNKVPLFTSCCPAWVKYVELFKPSLLDNLSTCKSPILMQGSIIKTYFALKNNIDPKDIISVAITPCTAKKAEIRRDEMNSSGFRDVDYVITTRELAKWIKEENIDFINLEDSNYDSLLGKGSGAGLIFGNTGGVMEAAIRCAYHILTGEDPIDELLNFKPVRGLEGVKEAVFKIKDKEIKLAVASSIKNAKKIIDQDIIPYDFIEVMACRGGCVAGGGNVKVTIPLDDDVRLARINSLYKEETKLKVRNSYQNPDIIKIYDEFLNNPLSNKALELLHTTYKNRMKEGVK